MAVLQRPPPPRGGGCLDRAYRSSQKGGTLIAGDVVDLAGHLRRLCDPSGYRPDRCRRCGARVHAHEVRERLLLGDWESPATTPVRVYRCADREGCGAVWRVLPAFLARCLWRSWRVVASWTLGGGRPASAPRVPRRTGQRWRARLGLPARVLVQLLAGAGAVALEGSARAAGHECTRRRLVDVLALATSLDEAARLSASAAMVHRLAPGVRIM